MRKAFVAVAVCVVAGLIGFASPALASGSPAKSASHPAQVAADIQPVDPAIQPNVLGPACYDPANICFDYAGSLKVDQRYTSPNRKAQLVFQNDGNLVVYDEFNNPRWASNTQWTGWYCNFQGDGNLVVYDSFNYARWASNTPNHWSDYLVIQGDGNVVIYDPGDVVLWATGTQH